MISVIYGAKDGENYLNREINDYGEYESAVKDIITAVRTDGDKALYGCSCIVECSGQPLKSFRHVVNRFSGNVRINSEIAHYVREVVERIDASNGITH